MHTSCVVFLSTSHSAMCPCLSPVAMTKSVLVGWNCRWLMPSRVTLATSLSLSFSFLI